MDTTQTTPAPRPSVDALVFDAYGTLFDVQALTAQCEADWPGQGAAVSALWRGTQLEYAWLRSLMGRYADFERCQSARNFDHLSALNFDQVSGGYCGA